MSFDQEYNFQKFDIFNFNLSKKVIDNDLNCELRNQSMKKVFIISREDFDRGIKHLKENNKINKFFFGLDEIEINFYTKANQIENNQDLDFIIVNEKFLLLLEINEKEYEDNNIFFITFNKRYYLYFPNDNHYILELFNDETNEKNKNSLKENTLKKLILLYANEKHFMELLGTPIKDEYDINEYYLINKNWIEEYKNKFNFKDIKKALDNMNLDDFSYKGFCYNLENLAKKDNLSKIKINDLKDENDFYKEYNFHYLKNKQIFKNIAQIQNYICPYEFIPLQENLFDLFYEDIIKEKFSSKNDYKFKILFGDNILFIQDNNNNLVFYLFTLDKTYELNFIFKFDNSNIFYNEVKMFIKGKGLYNYLNKRNIDYQNKSKSNDLLNEKGEIIGQYISFKKIDNKTKMKLILNQNKELYKKYQIFKDKVMFINDNQMNLDDTNDIYEKYKNKNLFFINVGIILQDKFRKLENDLFFNEIKEIMQIKDNRESEEKLNEIVNKFYKKVENYDVNNLFSHLDICDYNDIDNNNNYKYNLIDIHELNSIKKPYYYIETLYFKNKKEFFIFYPNGKKLYLLEDYNGADSFTLKECNFDSYYENIYMHLKGIYQNENKIKTQIKTSLDNIEQPKNYYLVNSDWVQNYKTIYKYNTFINGIKNTKEKIIKYLKLQNIPKEFKHNHNLKAKKTKILNKYDAPIDFELIDKNLFDKILKYINEKNNLKLQSDLVYPIFFGEDKIFININNIYFIYSSKGKEYKLEYIIKLINDNSIQKICSKCENNENFEQLMAKYGIDFSSKNEQKIIDDNLNIIGNFVNIEKKNSVEIVEPNHCLGLENIGATCYMNATIQCLCNIFNLKKNFQDKNLMYKFKNKGNCPLTKEFYKLVKNLWKKPKKKNYFTPTDFKDCISKMNPLFKGIAANDSKDLIIFIYETIHAEINEQRNFNININDNQELALFRKDYYSKNCSFLIDIFYFEQQSELTCLNCNFTKISYNIANIIIFPLEKVREYMIKKSPQGFISVTLDNCFENFQEVELLSGENQIFCNNCYRMSNATTGNKIFTSPEVMTIILNRGKGLEFEVNFEYPLQININKYVIDKSSTENLKYNLICVLCHYGPSGMAGHFIAFCLSPVDGNWYCYNDSQVSQCKDPRFEKNGSIEGIPYVLFYQKSDINNKQNINFNDEEEKFIKINDDLEDNKNQDIINLNFNYEEKQFNLFVSKNMKIKNVIKKLTKENNLPRNITLFFDNNGNFDKLDDSKYIKDYDIKNNSELTIIYIN